jgi:ABC-type lipoprotein export system ATPase subunit
VILADEPTSQLDRQNAKLVMECLVEAAESGRIVVVVTHDVDAVPAAANRLELTRTGLVKREG